MLRQAVKELAWSELPEEFDAEQANDDELRNLWEMLLNRNIVDCKLKCNGCAQEYPVSKGIVDMELNEEDV